MTKIKHKAVHLDGDLVLALDNLCAGSLVHRTTMVKNIVTFYLKRWSDSQGLIKWWESLSGAGRFDRGDGNVSVAFESSIHNDLHELCRESNLKLKWVADSMLKDFLNDNPTLKDVHGWIERLNLNA